MENTGKIINDTDKTKTNENNIDKVEEMLKDMACNLIETIADIIIEMPKEEFCKEDGMKNLYAHSFIVSIKGKISELEKNIDKFTDEDYDKIIENLEPLNNMLKTLIK